MHIKYFKTIKWFAISSLVRDEKAIIYRRSDVLYTSTLVMVTLRFCVEIELMLNSLPLSYCITYHLPQLCLHRLDHIYYCKFQPSGLNSAAIADQLQVTHRKVLQKEMRQSGLPSKHLARRRCKRLCNLITTAQRRSNFPVSKL